MRVRFALVVVAMVIMALAPGCRCYFDPFTNTWFGVDDDPTSPDFGYWAWDGPTVWMEGLGTWQTIGDVSYLNHNGWIWLETWGITGTADFAGWVWGRARFVFQDGGRGMDSGRGTVWVDDGTRAGKRFVFSGMRDREAEEDWEGGTAADAPAPGSRQELRKLWRE